MQKILITIIIFIVFINTINTQNQVGLTQIYYQGRQGVSYSFNQAISPDRSLIAVPHHYGKFRIYNPDGDILHEELLAQVLRGCAFNNSGTTVAVSNFYNMLYTFDTTTFTKNYEVNHIGNSESLVYSYDDSKIILSNSIHLSIRNASDGSEIRFIQNTQNAHIYFITSHPTENLIYITSNGQRVSILNLDDDSNILVEQSNIGYNWYISINPNGNDFIIPGYTTNGIRQFNAYTGEFIQSFNLPNNGIWTFSCSYSPTGEYIVAINVHRQIIIIRTETNEAIEIISTQHPFQARRIFFSSDSQRIFAIDEGSYFGIYEATTPLPVAAPLDPEYTNEDSYWDATVTYNAQSNWIQPNPSAGQGNNSQSDLSVCDSDSANYDSDYTLIVGTYAKNGQTSTEQQCWQKTEAQECYDLLGNLDDIGYDKQNDVHGDIINHCRIRDVNGEKYYDFLLTWDNDFIPTDNCISQEINFIQHDPNSNYNPATDDPDTDTRTRVTVQRATENWSENSENNEYPHNQWWYNTQLNQITFSIDHEDLVDTWLCHYQETSLDDGSEVYQWLCDLEINVIFSGEVQFSYQFQAIYTLDRTVSDSIQATVQRNVVVGECCENQLDITSELFFCPNISCTNDNGDSVFEDGSSEGWISKNGESIKQVSRNQIFYVAHRINTAEFQDMFLQPISLHIGPFTPKIHTWQQISHTVTGTSRSSTNVLVYEVESFVALDTLSIKSIAMVDDRYSQENQDLADNDDFENGSLSLPGYDGVDFNSPAYNYTPPTQNRRNLLQNQNNNNNFRNLNEGVEELGKDYKISAENNLSISNQPQSQNQPQQQQKSQVLNGSSLINLNFGVFCIIALIILY